MTSSLSNPVDNLAEETHKIKCKHSGIKYKDCECCLEYTNVKDDSILYKCLSCYKN